MAKAKPLPAAKAPPVDANLVLMPAPGTPPGDPQGVLGVLQQITDAIMRGDSITSQQSSIESLIHGQEGRAELIGNLILTNDFGRVTKFLSLRGKLEGELLDAASRDGLLAHEKMAFLAYMKAEIKDLEAKISNGATNVKDLASLLSKVDYRLALTDRAQMQKLVATNPQAREIIRRTAVRAKKLADQADMNSPVSPTLRAVKKKK